MARSGAEITARIAFRLPAGDKATIRKAAHCAGLDVSSFVRQHALRAAEAIIERGERIVLSERESMRLLALLDEPPQPTGHLRRAARNVPKDALR